MERVNVIFAFYLKNLSGKYTTGKGEIQAFGDVIVSYLPIRIERCVLLSLN
jgi:hypothetical protein